MDFQWNIYIERKPVLQWDDLFSSCSIIVFIFCNGFFQIALKNSPGIRQCICFGPQRVECEKGVTNRVNALLMNHPAAVLKDCLKMPIHLEDTWKKKRMGDNIHSFCCIQSNDLAAWPFYSPCHSSLGKQCFWWANGILFPGFKINIWLY